MTDTIAFYEQEFAHCPRSAEWKAGALRGCQLEAGEVKPGVGRLPYASGTAADDAYCAGIQTARQLWRALNSKGLQ